MLEYKQKRNNGRTPFAGVYKFVCVCVCVCGGTVVLKGHFNSTRMEAFLFSFILIIQ